MKIAHIEILRNNFTDDTKKDVFFRQPRSSSFFARRGWRWWWTELSAIARENSAQNSRSEATLRKFKTRKQERKNPHKCKWAPRRNQPVIFQLFCIQHTDHICKKMNPEKCMTTHHLRMACVYCFWMILLHNYIFFFPFSFHLLEKKKKLKLTWKNTTFDSSPVLLWQYQY